MLSKCTFCPPLLSRLRLHGLLYVCVLKSTGLVTQIHDFYRDTSSRTNLDCSMPEWPASEMSRMTRSFVRSIDMIDVAAGDSMELESGVDAAEVLPDTDLEWSLFRHDRYVCGRVNCRSRDWCWRPCLSIEPLAAHVDAEEALADSEPGVQLPLGMLLEDEPSVKAYYRLDSW